MDPDLQQLERAVQADPHNLDDLHALARAYVRQGRAGQACRLLFDNGALDRADPLLFEIGAALAEDEEALLRDELCARSIQVAARRDAEGSWDFAYPSDFIEAGVTRDRRLPVRAIDLSMELDDRVGRELIARLTRFAALEHIELTDYEAGDRILAYLPPLPALRSLDLSLCDQISDAGLAPLAALTGLHHLDLGQVELGDAGLRHLVDLTELRSLNLNGGSLTDQGLTALARMTQLTDLDLAANEISDQGLTHLTGLTQLRRLVLRDNPEIKGPGLAALAPLSRLAVLDLEGLDLTDAQLDHLRRFPSLRELILDRCLELRPAAFASLEALTALETLSLQYNELDAPALSALARLPRLRRLNLEDARGLNEAALAALAPAPVLEELWLPACYEALASFPKLRRLNIRFADLSDEGLGFLARVSSLQHINLEHSSGFTETGLAQLAALPRLQHLEVDSDVCEQSRVRELINTPRSPEETAALLAESRRLAARAQDPQSLERRAAIALELGQPGRAYQLLQEGGARPLPESTLLKVAAELVSGEEELLEDCELEAVELAYERKGETWAWFPASNYLIETIGREHPSPVSAVRVADAAAADDQLGAFLQKLPALRAVQHLELTRPDEAAMSSLPPNLNSLKLEGGAPLSEETLKRIAGLGLRRLSLIDHGINDAAIDKLAALDGLRELDLTGGDLSDSGLVALARAFPQLAKLRLDGNRRITGEGLAQLSELRELFLAGCQRLALPRLKGLTSLVELRLEDLDLAGVDLEPLAGLTKLRRLSLAAGRGLQDQQLAALAPLETLRELDLSATGIGGQGLARLGGTRLNDLELRACRSLTQDGLAALAALRDLEALSLSGAALRGLKLDALAALPRLAELDLSDSDIDADALAGLSGAANLTSLNLSRCTELDQEDIAIFAGAPRLTLVVTEGLDISPSRLRALLSAPKTPEQVRVLEAELAALDARPETSSHLKRRADIELELGRPGRSYQARIDHGAMSRGEPDFWALAAELAAEEDDLLASIHSEATRFAAYRGADSWMWQPAASLRSTIHNGSRPVPVRAVDLETPKTDPEARRILERLSELQALEHLQTRRGPLDTDDLRALAAHPTLRSLELTGGPIDGEGLRVLAPAELVALTILHLALDDKDLEHLRAFPRLGALALLPGHASAGRLRGPGLEELAALEALRSLRLEGAAIDDDALRPLAALTGLEELSLSGCAALTDRGLAALAPLNRLGLLDVSAAALTGSAFAGRLESLDALQTLKLNRCAALTADGLTTLAALPRLSTLEIQDFPMLDEARLRALSLTRELRDLDLSGSGFDASGLVHLASMTRLDTLDLSRTRADDAALEVLADGQIYELKLRGCGAITEVGIQSLARCEFLGAIDLTDTAIPRRRALELLPQVRNINGEYR